MASKTLFDKEAIELVKKFVGKNLSDEEARKGFRTATNNLGLE